MRVIAGNFKGRRIICPKGRDIRPTTDKVKEAMFAVMQFELPGACVLDAFAGTGALGIEALSRGAQHVDFVEKDPSTLRVLNENLSMADTDSFGVFKGDMFKVMPKLKKYDIVLLDPPYDSGLYESFLIKADENGILNKGCITAVECRRKFDFIIPIKYNLVKNKDYGDISLWFLHYGA